VDHVQSEPEFLELAFGYEANIRCKTVVIENAQEYRLFVCGPLQAKSKKGGQDFACTADPKSPDVLLSTMFASAVMVHQ